MVSVGIGFYSHVLLDAFTHKSGFFVMKYSFLREYIMGIPVYKMLQHSLSIVGLIFESSILTLLLRKTQVDQSYARMNSRTKIRFGAVVLFVTIMTVILKFSFSTSTNYIGMLVVSLISGCFLGIVVSSIIYRIRFK